MEEFIAVPYGTAITGQDITQLTHYNRHAATSVF